MEEQPAVVGGEGELARRKRGAHQGNAIAHAQAGPQRGLGEHFRTGAAGVARVSGALQRDRGLRTRVQHLARDGEQRGLDTAGWPVDADKVGVERAADHGLWPVRVTDEGFGGTGVRVDFRVRAGSTAQPWPDGAVERTTEVAWRADADVAGDIDRPPARGGDVDRLYTIGVGDGVGTGAGHRDADTDAGEALLVAIHRVFRSERRFHAGYVGIQFITAVAHGRDGGLGQEPEHFRWPVVGEHQRQGVVVDARLRQQGTHVCWCARGAGDPRADGT
ncbi:hypothetical protein D3C81_1398420 [compost metagenome]